MSGEHGDLLRDAVGMVVRELMEAEIVQLTGAGRGERAEGRVTQLWTYGMDKNRVSWLCRELDENVEQLRQRPLEAAYPLPLRLDAKHVKVRDRGRVVSKALVVAYAVAQGRPSRGDRPGHRRSRV